MGRVLVLALALVLGATGVLVAITAAPWSGAHLLAVVLSTTACVLVWRIGDVPRALTDDPYGITPACQHGGHGDCDTLAWTHDLGLVPCECTCHPERGHCAACGAFGPLVHVPDLGGATLCRECRLDLASWQLVRPWCMAIDWPRWVCRRAASGGAR